MYHHKSGKRDLLEFGLNGQRKIEYDVRQRIGVELVGMDDDAGQVAPDVQLAREEGHGRHAHLVEAYNFADSAFCRVGIVGIECVHMNGPRFICNFSRRPKDDEACVLHLDEKRLQGCVSAQAPDHLFQKLLFLVAVAEHDATLPILLANDQGNGPVRAGDDPLIHHPMPEALVRLGLRGAAVGASENAYQQQS